MRSVMDAEALRMVRWAEEEAKSRRDSVELVQDRSTSRLATYDARGLAHSIRYDRRSVSIWIRLGRRHAVAEVATMSIGAHLPPPV